MKQVTAQELATQKGEQVVDVLTAGIKIIDMTAPLLKELFNKVGGFIAELGGANSPKNVRKRLAALEAKDLLQKEQNRLFEERLLAVEAKG